MRVCEREREREKAYERMCVEGGGGWVSEGVRVIVWVSGCVYVRA